MLGKVSGVAELEEYREAHSRNARYIVNVSEIAKIDIPNIDFKFLNPVKYCSINDFNIDLSKLHFEQVEKPQKPLVDLQPISLSIAEAKVALALHYGVEQEKIEIIIRG